MSGADDILDEYMNIPDDDPPITSGAEDNPDELTGVPAVDASSNERTETVNLDESSGMPGANLSPTYGMGEDFNDPINTPAVDASNTPGAVDDYTPLILTAAQIADAEVWAATPEGRAWLARPFEEEFGSLGVGDGGTNPPGAAALGGDGSNPPGVAALGDGGLNSPGGFVNPAHVFPPPDESDPPSMFPPTDESSFYDPAFDFPPSAQGPIVFPNYVPPTSAYLPPKSDFTFQAPLSGQALPVQAPPKRPSVPEEDRDKAPEMRRKIMPKRKAYAADMVGVQAIDLPTSQANSQSASVEDTLARGARMLQESREQRDQLENDLAVLRDEFATSQQNLQFATAQLQEAQQQVHAKDQAFATSQQNLQLATTELQEAQQQGHAKNNEFAALQQNLQRTTAQLQEAQQHAYQKDNELVTIKQNTDSQRQELLQQLHDKHSEFTATILNLKAQLEELQAAAADRQSAQQNLLESDKELERVQESLAEARALIDKEAKRAYDAESEQARANDELQGVRDQLSDVLSKLADTEKELHHKGQQYDKLAKELSTLKPVTMELSESRAQIDELRKELDSIKTSTVRNDSRTLQDLQDSIRQKALQLTHVTRDFEDRQKRDQDEIDRLHKENDRKDDDLAKLRMDMRISKRKEKEGDEDRKHAENEVASLQDEITRLKGSLAHEKKRRQEQELHAQVFHNELKTIDGQRTAIKYHTEGLYDTIQCKNRKLAEVQEVLEQMASAGGVGNVVTDAIIEQADDSCENTIADLQALNEEKEHMRDRTNRQPHGRTESPLGPRDTDDERSTSPNSVILSPDANGPIEGRRVLSLQDELPNEDFNEDSEDTTQRGPSEQQEVPTPVVPTAPDPITESATEPSIAIAVTQVIPTAADPITSESATEPPIAIAQERYVPLSFIVLLALIAIVFGLWIVSFGKEQGSWSAAGGIFRTSDFGLRYPVGEGGTADESLVGMFYRLGRWLDVDSALFG